jgi:hypothetical protein
VKIVLLPICDNDFYLISNLPISKISFHEPIINLSVCYFNQSFQNDVAGNEELLLVINKFHDTVTIGQVMHGDRLSEHVVSNTSHLNCVSREKATPVDECWPLKGNWVIPLVHDQHSDDPLISIDDEVSSELKSIFLSLG